MAECLPTLQGQMVGALACQKDSYRRTMEAKVVSCVKYSPPKVNGGPKKKKATSDESVINSDSWLVEFSDSVLFPEGGGQPCDHGSVVPLSPPDSKPIPVTRIERQGLKCVYFVGEDLEPGIVVRQDVDFKRRWDHMQQHTGQHLLSAIMDTYDNLDTVGWGMGADGGMNYVDLPRKPSQSEMQAIQDRCNEAIRQNLSITVTTPDDNSSTSDHDPEKGLVRVISIGDIDQNACCGTHLAQTSHISLILLHHTQPIHGKNCRLYFSVGDRAIKASAESINALRSVAQTISSSSDPTELIASVSRINDTAADLKRRERNLLSEIAKYEGDRVKAILQSRKKAWVCRPSGTLDFLNMVIFEVRDTAQESGVVVLAAGEGQAGGPIVVVGERNLVSEVVKKIQEVMPSVKGGGKGERWQGKVKEWKKEDLEAIRMLVE
ncbi:threonyl and alanyl tRNA synthetase second additional domain-containing protein [Dactylonectria estremocensis]|uniref:Threonyl and alanyl tRNA synthetase second additional domain-containing protein n=1 Tax=Dactylonectria estremocensis TaxID=1079267 RepID=A0A9P9EPW1_9HYPO|nr:threonyl and alanyl tRNA synthetase second additional domain-containing protein [Dactylonectria estremocensis]